VTVGTADRTSLRRLCAMPTDLTHAPRTGRSSDASDFPSRKNKQCRTNAPERAGRFADL